MQSNLTIALVTARQAEAALVQARHDLPRRPHHRLRLVFPLRGHRRGRLAPA